MNASTPTTGYYSVIQYCPDHSRMEAANVGVLLFVPALGYVRARMSSNNDRIRHFFGDEAGDNQQIKRIKEFLERRIAVEAPALTEYSKVERFVRLFANELVFTDLRPVRVENADTELVQLYNDLVAPRIQKEAPRPLGLMRSVRARFGAPDIEAKLRRDLTVQVPIMGIDFKVDYGFLNGRMNLVQVKEFTQSKENDLFKEACRTAATGRLISLHPDKDNVHQKLIVIAALNQQMQSHQCRVEEMLKEHGVEYYSQDNIEQLAQHIIANAH
jgi:hypothetical protein